MEPAIRARMADDPDPLPPIDRALISRLVREFYARVRRDERLGPIFDNAIAEDEWETHLQKLTGFWCAVMLKTGEYQGRPVPAHLKLKGVVEEDFAIWLRLFGETARDHCAPEVADLFVERAERIAQSLRLAMFFRLPPNGGDAG